MLQDAMRTFEHNLERELMVQLRGEASGGGARPLAPARGGNRRLARYGSVDGSGLDEIVQARVLVEVPRITRTATYSMERKETFPNGHTIEERFSARIVDEIEGTTARGELTAASGPAILDRFFGSGS